MKTAGPIWASTGRTGGQWSLGTSRHCWSSLDSSSSSAVSILLRWASYFWMNLSQDVEIPAVLKTLRFFGCFGVYSLDVFSFFPFFFLIPTGNLADSCGPAEAWETGNWWGQRSSPQPSGPVAPPRVCGHIQTLHGEAPRLLGAQQQGTRSQYHMAHGGLFTSLLGKMGIIFVAQCKRSVHFHGPFIRFTTCSRLVVIFYPWIL